MASDANEKLAEMLIRHLMLPSFRILMSKATHDNVVSQIATALKDVIDEREKQHVLEWHSITGRKEQADGG